MNPTISEKYIVTISKLSGSICFPTLSLSATVLQCNTKENLNHKCYKT